MKQFKKQKLNRKGHLFIKVLATIVSILLTPIFIYLYGIVYIYGFGMELCSIKTK